MNEETMKRVWAEKLSVYEDDIYFFEGRKEPWIGYKSLLRLARDKGFNEIECIFVEYNTHYDKVIWMAAINADGKTYRASGLAGRKEMLANGKQADPDYLAASRALRMALSMAGFDPMRDPTELSGSTDLYHQQLATIHKLAHDIGLIKGKDDTVYRQVIKLKYGVESATELDRAGRADLIDRLRNWKI